MPPGSPLGAGSATPARKASPLNRAGSLTCQVLEPVSKAAVAWVAPGVKVMAESGTGTVESVPPAEKVTEALVTCRVTGALPRPLTLATLLNQTVAPAGMAVPLKLETMLLADGCRRSSRSSTVGGRWAGWRGVP